MVQIKLKAWIERDCNVGLNAVFLVWYVYFDPQEYFELNLSEPHRTNAVPYAKLVVIKNIG